ncbi:MAG: aminoacetone oxidase family FAD-binding enzyme [Candidatus Hydrogenedentota bacterium]
MTSAVHSSGRVVVIGAGAAGTMAAVFAADSGAETILLERTADGGRKILISGGGRCNILPSKLDESRFISDSSHHSLRKILQGWSLPDQREFFERDAGIPLVEEEESGKLFPASNKARDVRDRLLALAARKGARFLPRARVTGLHPARGGWRVEMEHADPVEAGAVIVATGGLSVPQTGSDGGGLSIVAILGHTVHPLYPALTPLHAGTTPFTALAGISLDVTMTARDDAGGRNAKATGGFLFTHHGFSGPSVLDVSHVAVRAREAGGKPARLTVQWTQLDEESWKKTLASGGARLVVNMLRLEMPARLADVLMSVARVDPSRTLANLRREERIRLIDALVRCELPCTGDAGYQKAEVTGGGISLAEIDPRTMESRRHPGLFLCGEMLDAFGPIGGYNFLWAWVTGRAAGRSAARAMCDRSEGSS